MSAEPPADEPSFVLEYQLREDDVRRYRFRHYPGPDRHLLGWPGWACRGRKKALLILVLLGLFLVATCWNHARHPRPALLAIGVVSAFLVGLVVFHFRKDERQFLRLIGGMGLPDDCSATFDAGGMIVSSQSDRPGRGWHDSWPGVRNVGTAPGLIYIRFRRSAWVLIVPDRAFDSIEARAAFFDRVRAWHERGKETFRLRKKADRGHRP